MDFQYQLVMKDHFLYLNKEMKFKRYYDLKIYGIIRTTYDYLFETKKLTSSIN